MIRAARQDPKKPTALYNQLASEVPVGDFSTRPAELSGALLVEADRGRASPTDRTIEITEILGRLSRTQVHWAVPKGWPSDGRLGI